jgi:His/Glu/Gln/Arg/opine family amino acid ABC transporter permease subunit
VDVIQQLLLFPIPILNTLAISVLSFLFGLALGFPLSLVKAYMRRLGYFVDVYEKIFRGIPEPVLILMFYLGMTFYLPFPFSNPYFTVIFALTLRSAANQSQIFRGAIRGVGDEQMAAARSSGFSKPSAIRHIIIPQVFTYATPGLGNEYALLVKDSAYAFAVGIIEITKQAELIRSVPPYDIVTPYIIAAILYILLTFPIATYFDTWGSRRKKKLGL